MGSEDEFSSDVSTSMDRNYCMMYPVSDGVNNMEMDIGVR
jgi:hypothetical protein